jgi:serine/threonine protein kinase
MLKLRRASDLKLFTLNPKASLGSGGEGNVFSTGSRLAAKIYRQPSKAIQQKLTAMLAKNSGQLLSKQESGIAWPVDLLLDEADQIVGFLMPQAVDARPIVDYYNPKTRLGFSPFFSYRSLHRTARNLAAAVENLHRQGYVIGDLNESNILVTQTAQVTLVDADSIQVIDGDKLYHCRVGKAEFMPPELQGKNLSEVTRTIEQDNFALAILIFQTLMEGNHPFAGIYSGEGEPPTLAARIAVGHFPYGNQPVPYHPSPLALPFTTLHLKLQEYFLRCFIESQENPQVRPTATQWSEALALAEKELSICKVNARHIFGSHLNDCPWCYRKALLNGRDPFPRHNWDVKKINEAVVDTFRKMDIVVLLFLCLYILIFITMMITGVVESRKTPAPTPASNQVLPTVTAYPSMSVSSSPRLVTASSNPYPISSISVNEPSKRLDPITNLIGTSNVTKYQFSFCKNGSWLSLAEGTNSEILKDFKVDCPSSSNISARILRSVWQRYVFIFHRAELFTVKPNAITADLFSAACTQVLSRNTLSSNGLYFASIVNNDENHSNSVYLFEAHSGKFIQNMVSVEDKNIVGREFSALAFSPDSKVVAIAQANGRINFYSVKSGRFISAIHDSIVFANNLKFIANGDLLLVSDAQNNFYIVNLTTGKITKEFKDTLSGGSMLVFSSDNKMSATINSSGAKIAIRDILSGKVLRTFAVSNQNFCVLVFSKNGKKIAVIDSKNNASVYDLMLK